MGDENSCKMTTTGSTLTTSTALEVPSPVGKGKTWTSSSVALISSTMVLGSTTSIFGVCSGVLPEDS